MPVITIQIGPIQAQQKTQLIRQLTQQAAEITGIPQSAFITVIQQSPDENIGVGGTPLDQIKRAYSEQS